MWLGARESPSGSDVRKIKEGIVGIRYPETTGKDIEDLLEDIACAIMKS
jgi:hypothetical protein